MAHKGVELFKRAFVEELGNALAGSEFAAFVLFVDSFLAATEVGFFAQFDEFLHFFELCTHFDIV